MKPLRTTIVGVTVFAVLALVCGALIYLTVGNHSLESRPEFVAEFQDVSGLRANAEVQVAGVPVGRVTAIELTDDNVAQVRFTLDEQVPITGTSRVVVRYKDLLGRRYLEIRPGANDGRPLEPGSSIPVDQTAPALDLDQVYNGFSPLFEGLQPGEVNQLASSLVAVLQGESENLEQLLGRLGSLTDTVADRDELVGDVIANLNGVLGVIDRRSPQTDRALRMLRSLVSGLAEDRQPLTTSLARIARATLEISSLVGRARPALRGDLEQLRRLSRVINADGQEFADLLANTPGYEELIGRVGIYQSAFQFYLCGVQIRFAPVDGGKTVTTPMTQSQEERCQF